MGKIKLAKPNSSVMTEYLYVMGEDWVRETYGYSKKQINDIVYGFPLPTEERDIKKKANSFRKDVSNDKYGMNQSYYHDNFIWELELSEIEDCEEDDEEPHQPSSIFIEKWTNSYCARMKKDMAYNKNMMTNYGWSLGSRVINKTTSKSTDDIIHDFYLDLYLKLKLAKWSTIEKFINMKISYKSDPAKEKLDNLKSSMYDTLDIMDMIDIFEEVGVVDVVDVFGNISG